MPIILIEIAEGRTNEQKALLAKEITKSVSEIFKVDKDRVTIIFHESPKTHIARAGVMMESK